MGFVGMDADAVDGIGRGLGQQAEAVAQVMASIDALMGEIDAAWDGADSERFRDAWGSQHRPAVDRVRGALEDYGATALAQAAEQHGASS